MGVLRTGRSALAIVVAGALFAACTPDEPVARQSPGTTEGELVSTDDALPSGFPDEIDIPEPSTIIYSATSSLGSSVFVSSSLVHDDVKRRFLDIFDEDGWTLHTCSTTPQQPEPITTIVASRDGYTTSVLIGYSPQNAARLNGQRYSFLVSVATTGDPPVITAEPC